MTVNNKTDKTVVYTWQRTTTKNIHEEIPTHITLMTKKIRGNTYEDGQDITLTTKETVQLWVMSTFVSTDKKYIIGRRKNNYGDRPFLYNLFVWCCFGFVFFCFFFLLCFALFCLFALVLYCFVFFFSCLVLFCFVFVAIIYHVYRQYREYILFTLNYFEGRVTHHGSQNKTLAGRG